MPKEKIQNYINHIVFVVDKSGSMQHLARETVKVFDSQIQYLAQRSKELNQETRVSVYLFNTGVECLIYDMDVMRLPSLANHYEARGGTALIEATITALDDLALTPQKYGDHAFLIYDLTDGQNTENGHLADALARKINSLPENWTVAVLVPNAQSIHEAKKFGFPANNIQVWSTEQGGVEKAGETIRMATNNYMMARATGIRGTKSLFNIDVSGLNASVVRNVLEELKPSQYELFPVHKDSAIKDYVESWTGKDYLKGSSYFMLTKPENVQAYKQVCIQDKSNGKVYSGANARKLIALPDYEVRVNPASYGNYDIFVQSTSTNRKLLKGTKIIVLK